MDANPRERNVQQSNKRSWKRRSVISGILKEIPSKSSSQILKCLRLALKDNRLGWTPLHHAASKGYSDIIPSLLQCGVPLEARTFKRRETALHIAAAYNQLSSCKRLKAHWANLEAVNKHGETPLLIAPRKVGRLLDISSNPRCSMRQGNFSRQLWTTPLWAETGNLYLTFSSKALRY